MHVCSTCKRQLRTFGALVFHNRQHRPEVNWRRIFRGFK